MINIKTLIPILTLSMLSFVLTQMSTETKEFKEVKIEKMQTLIKQVHKSVFEIPTIPIEIEEPLKVEPIEVYALSKKLDTLLPLITIKIEDFRPCGCQPSPVNFIRMPDDSTEIENDYSIFAEPIYAEPDRFDANVYPNPTKGDANLALDVETEGQYQIFIYDMNGRRVREIHSGELFMGRNNIKLDLSDLNSGMYFVQVLAEGQNETLKIQKL